MQSFTEKQIKNLFEMFEYRKYTRSSSNNTDDTLYFIDTVNGNNLVCVKFMDSEKINVDNIRIFIAYIDKHDLTHGIVICKNDPSIQVMKEISTLSMTFEIFHSNQLNINISKHSLVPIHTLLSKEEATKIKNDYQASFSLFPKIKYSDSMARYIGAKCGDLIKIEKPGQYVTFRFVIK